MRRTILVLAVALVAGTAEVRADLVTYNMSGTILDAWNGSNSTFSKGDHLTWTLQYDKSTPLSSSGAAPGGSWAGYDVAGKYVLTNIIDQTTGYHFPLLSPSMYNGGIGLSNGTPGGYRGYSWGNMYVDQRSQFIPGRNAYSLVGLNLLTAPLPSLDLAKFQFDKLPVVWSNAIPVLPQDNTNFQWIYQNGNLQLGITASVDSIPGALLTPEPGSLMLFLLGAAGLAARGMRRRMGQGG
jgi:hypothetical protein